MLEVALDRLLGMVARMEGMTVRHVRVVRSLLVRTGLMVFRRFLMMSRSARGVQPPSYDVQPPVSTWHPPAKGER